MQRSSEWLQDRLGKFTASEIYKLMGKSGFGKTGETYIYQNVCEELTGEISPDINTKAIQWGIETEPYAVDYYHRKYGKTDPIDFITHYDIPETGCSPDRVIIKEKKGLEIKCPFLSVNHIKHLQSKSADVLKKHVPNYYWQVLHSMWVTEFDTWEFCSYDPRMPDNLMMSRLVIARNDVIKDIEVLCDRVKKAILLKKQILNQIKS